MILGTAGRYRLRTAGLFAAVLSMMLPAEVSDAGLTQPGVTTSYHDFTGLTGPGQGTDLGFVPGGVCTACHREHYAPDARGIWSRDLSQEDTYFEQNADPDYIPGTTLLCYDCHVDYITGGTGAEPDNSPPDGDWVSGQEPEDIAFTDGPADPPSTSVTGYYELVDGTVPTSTNEPENPPLTPPVTDPTGGHYWKGALGSGAGTLTGGYSWGDKLACSICHDVHDAASGFGVDRNEVMLRNDAYDDGGLAFEIGTGLTASSLSRNHTIGDGRDMCAGCHHYSDADVDGVSHPAPPADPPYKTLFGVDIPTPPLVSFNGHLKDDTNECVACHPHNSPDCGGCHGNPPPIEAAGYGGIDETKGPHPKHALDTGDSATTEYAFDCMICHNTFPDDHRTNQPPQSGDYQDVTFDTEKNTQTTGTSYTTATRQCSDLYCHSRGTSIDDVTAGDGSTTITWTAADWDANDLGCDACHGGEVASIPGAVTYGAPAYADDSVKENCHPKHPYACSTCHYNVIRDSDPLDGWTLYNDPTTDVSLHVSNDATTFTYNVDPDTTDPQFGGYTYDPLGGTCTNITCHGSGAAYASAQWCEPPVGIDICEWCHLTPAATPDVDSWDLFDNTISQISKDQWESTGHGLPAASWFPWPMNYPTSYDDSPTDGPELGCLTTDPAGDTPVGGCHTDKVGHRVLENPYRLATPNNTTFFFENPSGTIDENSLNEFCSTCHLKDRELTHSKEETSGDSWGTPVSAPQHFKCIDCHDPHGDSSDYMIHDGVFADSSVNDAYRDYGLPSEIDLGIQGPVTLDVTEPDQLQTDYVDLNVPDASKVCMVCHQSNNYFTRSSTTDIHNPGLECIHCHPHNKGIQPVCELCHSATTPFVGDYPVLGDDRAPNIMGDGTNSEGIGIGGNPPRPFDDGTWGYNVNGHGRFQLECTPDPLDPTGNPGCHDIGIPPDIHLDGTHNTAWLGDGAPAEFPDTRNSNTSHLMVEGTRDGFFDSTAPTNDYEYQTFFDDSCAGQNRQISEGCHDTVAFRTSGCPGLPECGDYHRHEMAHGDDIMRFGDHSTTADPKQDRTGAPDNLDLDLPWSFPPDRCTADKTVCYWVPWTMQDLSTDVGETEWFGTCVSCHDPHGTDPSIVSDQTKGSNHMLRFNWKSDPGFFCAVNCHNP